MVVSITVVCLLILALIHVPGFGPGADALACDRSGGVWANGTCQKTDSPLAGLAS